MRSAAKNLTQAVTVAARGSVALLPIENEKNVDKCYRRVGLGSMAEYQRLADLLPHSKAGHLQAPRA